MKNPTENKSSGPFALIPPGRKKEVFHENASVSVKVRHTNAETHKRRTQEPWCHPSQLCILLPSLGRLSKAVSLREVTSSGHTSASCLAIHLHQGKIQDRHKQQQPKIH